MFARKKPPRAFRSVLLARDAIVASFPARRAVIEPVLAEADVNLTLAQAAILVALTLVFGHLALHAAVFGLGRGGSHEQNVDLRLAGAKCRR